MLPSACGLAQHFQDLGHSLLVYGRTITRKITYLFFSSLSKGPAKRIQHVDATPSNIVESNMLHSFGHHVAPCCVMLDDVERSLNSIKHRLQHHPTFLLFSGVNKNVAFVWPPCSTLLNARMPTKLTCGYLYPWQLSTVYSCFGVAAWF